MRVRQLLKFLEIEARYNGSAWEAVCPNPNHDDHNPSWSIVDDGSDRTGSHYCKSCKFRGGPWELAAAILRMPLRDAGKVLQEIAAEGYIPKGVPRVNVINTSKTPEFRLPEGVQIPSLDGSRWFGPALSYLRKRGVTDDQIEKWGIGFALKGILANRVVIPVYGAGGVLRTYSARALSPSMHPRYEAGKKVHGATPKLAVFGEIHYDRTVKTVTVAEGCFSALALERAGAPNVSAILSSEVTPERLRIISTDFDRIIVATDPDHAGDAAHRAILPARRRAEIVRYRPRLSPDDMPHDELVSDLEKILA